MTVLLKLLRLPVCLVALTGAVACTQTGGPAPAPPNATSMGITPSTFRLPEGAGCSGEVARFRAVMENDRETGHVGRSVYDHVVGEIDRAAAACAAGREGEAIGALNGTKARYGYR